MKIKVYLDTNALYSDHFIEKDYSRDFLSLLCEDRVEVCVSPMVVAEKRRQVSVAVKADAKKLRKDVSEIAQKWGVDRSLISDQVDALVSSMEERASHALGPLLDHPACTVLPHSAVTAEELVQRELDELRPTKLSGDQSTGLRDTVIWHTILEDLEEGSDDVLILVTNDKGFLRADKGGLHAHLVADLEDHEVEPHRFMTQPDFVSTNLAIRELTEVISKREATIQRAFLDYLQQIDTLDWSDRELPDGSWQEAETYPVQIPANMVEAQVTMIEVESVDEPTSQHPSRCGAVVSVIFEGFMSSSEYFAEEESEVEWDGGGLDDPYISVSLTLSVRVEANAQFDVGDQSVHIEEPEFMFA